VDGADGVANAVGDVKAAGGAAEGVDGAANEDANAVGGAGANPWFADGATDVAN